MFTSLKPLSLFLALAYSSGAPAFDAVRPQAFDAPLRSFHQYVRLAAESGISTARQLARVETVRDSIELLPVATLFRQIERDIIRATAAR